MKNLLLKQLFLCVLCFTAAAGETRWKFDVGDEKQPPQNGWTRLGRRTAYNEKRGFGWVKEWGIPWNNPKDSGVGKDGINASRTGIDANFKCRIPNGVYRVTVTLGMKKASEGRTGQCVEINGRIVLAPPGVGGWGTQVERTFPAVVTDGMMNIRFFTTAARSSDRTCVGSIEIAKVPDSQRAAVTREFEAAPGADSGAAKPRTVQFGKHKLQVFHSVVNKPLPADAGTNPFFFIRDFSGDMLDDTVPRKGEYPAKINGFSAAGEINGFFAALHAPRKTTVKKIALTDLKSAKGVIPAKNAELFTLSCIYRSEYDANRFIGRKTAELLEYTLPAELEAGKTLPCYFTVEVPAGTPAGVYRGTFSAETSAGVIKAPVELTVSAIKLQDHKRDVILSSDSDRWRGMTDEEVKAELADMAKHGINGLTMRTAPGGGVLHEDADGNVIGADFDRLEPMLKHAAKLGLNRKILLSATNMILWGLKSLHISTRGTWQQKDGMLVISHGNERKSSEMRNTYWTAIFPKQRYRLSVNYRMPSGSARAEIRLFDSTRKPVGKAIRFDIPKAGDFTAKSFEFETQYPTAQFMFYFFFTGKENLELKELSLKNVKSPAGELLSHSRFRRTSSFNLNKKWPKIMSEQYRRIIAANAAAVKRLGFEPVIFGTDEAGNDPKNAVREIQELAEARKAGGVTLCNCSPAMAEKALPHLDIITCYSSFIPDTDPQRTLLKRYHKMGKKLFVVSAGTYARQNFSIMSNRYNAGFYIAKSGVDGQWIWTYQRSRRNPFDDFDAPTKDYGLVYPPRVPGGKPVKSIAWEGIREGIRDYTWFRNLEFAIEKAEKEKRSADAARGKTVLNCVLQAIPAHGSFVPGTFNDRAADRLRRLCAIGIEAANGKQLGNAALLKTPEVTRSARKVLPKQDPVRLIPAPAGASRWQKALQISSLYNYVTREQWDNPQYRTTFKLTADNENIYLLADMKYPKNAKSAKGKGDTAGFSGDHIEFLLEPQRGSGAWYQFAVNRHGQKSEMHCVGSRNAKENIFAVNYNEHKRDTAWSCQWEAKVTDKAGAWQAEITIPLKSIGAVNGNFWGVLIARCGIGTNIVNKPFGFFDQPEKFPTMIAAGKAGLQDVPVIPNVIGRSSLFLRFRNLKSGRFTLRETTKGKVSSFSSAVRKDGSIAPHYRLTPNTDKVELEAKDTAGNVVWQSSFGITMQKALVIDAPERVFFGNSGKLNATVQCNITKILAKSANIDMILKNTAGKVLFRKSYPAESAAFSLDLGALKNSFYRLTFNIREKKRIYTVENIDFAVLQAE